MFLHKPVGLLVIDDHALLPQVIGHLLIAKAYKLFGQDETNGYDHTVIVDYIAILHERMRRWLAALFTCFSVVVV